MRGAHCLKHWSSTQSTLALKSGEAELGGLPKGIPQGIGLRSLASDLGINLKLKLLTDATAAVGMSRRLAVGKVRHLDTSLLWVQGHVRSGDVLLQKVAGPDNPADSLTKHLAGPDLRRHMQALNLIFEEGRPASAPHLTTPSVTSLARDKEVMCQERARANQ